MPAAPKKPNPYATKIVGRQPDKISITEGFHEGGTRVTHEKSRYDRVAHLRYGSNPGEHAAYFGRDTLLGSMRELKTGKQGLSQTNLEEIVWALATLGYFPMPSVVAMKHENACGFAWQVGGEPLDDLYRKARYYNFRSGFGGTVGTNAPVTRDMARELVRTFNEGLVAPDVEEGVMDILASGSSKSKSIRVFTYDTEKLARLPRFVGDDFTPTIKQLPDGTIIRADPHLTRIRKPEDLLPYLVTDRQPTLQELQDMQAALYVDIGLLSNSCFFAKGGHVVGVARGHDSRIDAFEYAIEQNRKLEALADEYSRRYGIDFRGFADFSLAGMAAATSAFAPFEDSPIAAHEAGAEAMLFIEGGERFKEIVETMNKRGVSYITLPPEERHFRH